MSELLSIWRMILALVTAWLGHEMLLLLASGIDELEAFAKVLNGR